MSPEIPGGAVRTHQAFRPSALRQSTQISQIGNRPNAIPTSGGLDTLFSVTLFHYFHLSGPSFQVCRRWQAKMRSKSLGLTLCLVVTLIFLISRSYIPLFPKSVQHGIPDGLVVATLQEAHLGSDLSGHFSFSSKLIQHGAEEGSNLADIVGGGRSLHSCQAIADDYTCAVGRPCKNGACCGASGNCGYG